MTYRDILNRDTVRVLITGDSIAYNRYGYDPKGRLNARDCGAGLPSWAFSLRDRIYGLDTQLTLGADITADCPWVLGLDNVSEVPFTAVFGGRIKTLYPKDSACLSVPVRGERIVLYLQRRLENSCVFDISVDGITVLSDVDTAGDPTEFAGYALMTLALPCDASRESHTVTFRNIRGENPKITLAAVGSRHIQVSLTGKGGECTDYFTEHFDERIGAYQPDLLVVTLGANDRGYRSVFDMHDALVKLFSLLFSASPECRVLFLLPPPSHNPEKPWEDMMPFCSLPLSECYDRAIEAVCQNLGKEGYTCEGLDASRKYPIETMRISDLFRGLAVSDWRFDNIHMNPHGNQLLLDALCKKLGISSISEENP